MDPALRLQYLDAMGIPQFVARMPMPGAKPSVLITLPDACSNEALATDDHAIPPPSAPRVMSRLLDDGAPSPAVTTSAMTTSAMTTPRDNALAITPPSSTITPPTAPAHPDTTPFSCQTTIWRIDAWLVMADMPRFDDTACTLLANVLFAIGKVTTNLSNPSTFSWPMPEQLSDTSQQAARDYLQGYLEGGFLANNAIQQILIFGDQTASLLPESGPGRYGNWPLVTLPSLHSMAASPQAKAAAWHALAQVVSPR